MNSVLGQYLQLQAILDQNKHIYKSILEGASSSISILNLFEILFHIVNALADKLEQLSYGESFFGYFR